MSQYYTPTIIRSNRKALSLSLSPKGLILRVPARCSQSKIDNFLMENQAWIERNVKKIEEKERTLPHPAPLPDRTLPPPRGRQAGLRRAGRAVRATSRGGLSLHLGETHENPLGQLLFQGVAELQLPATVGTAGGAGQRGGTRALPPETHEPFGGILRAGHGGIPRVSNVSKLAESLRRQAFAPFALRHGKDVNS